MNRLITTSLAGLMAIAVCQPAWGLEKTFNISGHEIFGDFEFEFSSFSTNFGVPGTVTEVVMDATGESFGESLNSEIVVSIDTDFQFVDLYGEELDLLDTPGPFTILTAAPILVSLGSISGEVFLTLHEEFVDEEAPDSVFGPESSLTITFEPYIPVPAPEAIDLGQIATADTPFTIDTFGSDFDTELALYDAGGIIIDDNDDATSGGTAQSELDLADGLPSGDYYLAIGGFNTEFGPLGFNAAPQADSDGGDYSLNYPIGTTVGALAQESVEFFRFSIGFLDADFDDDGDVDGNDFLTWQSSFNKDSGGDANGDGNTDGVDLLIWESQFHSGAGGASDAAVPEPATFALSIMAVALMAGSRRRRRLPE